MKQYTLEQIEELMRQGQKIDMIRVSMETLNPVAFSYMNDCERGETKARQEYIKELNANNPQLALTWLQLYDFTKNSKEAVKYNFIQFENKIKQYNASLDAKKEKEKKS